MVATKTPPTFSSSSDGATATMPICIDDDDHDDDDLFDHDFDENNDDFIQQQIMLWNQAKSPPVAATATAATSTGESSNRKMERRDLEARGVGRQMIRRNITQRDEQERQDALLAKQLASQPQQQAWFHQKPTAQELQDALYAQQLASQLYEHQQTDENDRLALQLATRMMEQEDSLYMTERKRRLEQEESQGLAYAMQVQQQFEEEVATGHARRGKDEALQILDARTELRAFQYVEAKARTMHEAALPKLKERIQSLGFSDESLDQCLEYIREEAPIIIHFTENCLNNLVQDTHYRNLFETNSSGGCKDKKRREQWEHCLFGGAYDGCPPFQRPKYGCLNLSGDIAGVVPARHYGALFLTLASHMRYRCTFFDEDTGNQISTNRYNSSLATHNYYAHILLQYPDVDLTATLSVSRIRGAPSRCQKYKEVQIHGPICLSTDIQSLSVPGRYSTSSNELRQAVMAFQKQTRCNILWQHDLLHAEDDE
jgi:Protein of unknown function (DUF3626)